MTFGVGGTYSIEIGEGALDIHARYNKLGEQETALDNAQGTRQDSADFLHASMTYEISNYRVTLFGRNLTDEETRRVVDIPQLESFGQYSVGDNYGVEFIAEF